ncbi:MAG: Rpn family recombination-promoting nuclease/putative transposase [Proteobacteria bacterium]|nr:Rpn family recombination-promoting nuclease/putative transposase [Pseudomonadota bacterium]
MSKIAPDKFFISDEEYKEILGYVQEHYPNCFKANEVIPLAVGINNQIFERDSTYSKTTMRRFLGRYTRSAKYRKHLIVGVNRYNLDGTVSSQVLEEEISRSKWNELKQEKKGVKAKHDQLIKKALENPIIAQEFLDEYLPTEYKELIDLSTVKPEKETYIEESLKNKLSDMVFSVKIKSQKLGSNAKEKQEVSSSLKEKEVVKIDDEALIYTLIEHQSKSDHWIALRLLKYSLLLLERHATKKAKLPLIIPMIIYNGKKKYDAPRNIYDLFVYPELAKKALSEDHKIIDLQAMSEDTIDYQKHLSFLLYVMKNIHARDTIAMLEGAMKRCKQAIIIDQEQNYILTRLILWYTDSKVPVEQKMLLEQVCVDNLPKQDRDEVMRTIADAYIEEGYNKGLVQGIEKGEARGEEKKAVEIANNMLKSNLELKLISSVTGLSIDTLQKLKASL